MSPRPRTISDGHILEATVRVISRVGPNRLTLAHVAREVGLSPATLLQRFGSKRGLLLALAGGSVDYVDAGFAALRASHRSPLEAVEAGATQMARMARSPEELANHLAFLQIDLSDPDFHRLALAHAVRLEAGYRALLDEAVAAGELVPCDTARLARAVSAMSGGSLIGWAIHRQGKAVSWVRQDLAALLDPYRRPSRAARPAGALRRPGARRPR